MIKKTVIVSGFILGVLLVAGAFLEQRLSGVKNEQQLDQSLGENIKQTTNVSDWKIYRNDEYGFEIKLPGAADKWKIEKEVFSKKNSIYDSETVTLYFNYVLDESIPRVKDDPTSRKITDMSVWYVDIIPVRSWKQNACATRKIEDGPCRQGSVLGVNSSYVFESGFQNVEGAGRLCNESLNQQTEFCNVASYFYKAPEEMLKWDFRLVDGIKKETS